MFYVISRILLFHVNYYIFGLIMHILHCVNNVCCILLCDVIWRKLNPIAGDLHIQLQSK